MRSSRWEAAIAFPSWSADGEHVGFQSDRDGGLGIFWQRSEGATAAERLTEPDKDTAHVPESWSPDGKAPWSPDRTARSRTTGVKVAGTIGMQHYDAEDGKLTEIERPKPA